MDMSQYLEVFTEESKEYLQNLNKCLLSLEKNPHDASTINEIFRAAHTIKGMSGTMGFTRMAKLTHDMESVLSSLRNNEIEVSSNLIDLMFKCLDALEDYLDKISKTGNEGTNEYKETIDALNSFIKSEKEIVPAKQTRETQTKKDTVISGSELAELETLAIEKATEKNLNAYKIHITLNKDCLLKSARAFVIFQLLERFSDIVETEPRITDIENEKFDHDFIVFIVSDRDGKLFSDELKLIYDIEKITVEKLMGCGYSNQKGAASVTDTIGKKKPAIVKTARIEVDKLDNLMNLVGELIITKTRLQGYETANKSKDYRDTIEYLEKISAQLNDAVMKVRMVPVETVFSRFPRMIRDVSRELGKEIIFTTFGEETELDRMVVDEIGDPLMHLVRNAADHGIETPDIRLKTGKTKEGHINLKAYRDGNNVVIEIEDDGMGINLKKAREKAVKKGLINEKNSKNLSEKDIIDFIFLPNFSTSANVTGMSGRGVGLDVVKTKVESLNGNVEVQTAEGVGCKFIIRLPMTLSIIQALLVYVGDEKYAIPINSIYSLERIPVEEIKTVQKNESMMLRKLEIPLVRLDKILKVTGQKNIKKKITIVVVNRNEKLMGLVVDGLIGQYEMVIKSMGKLLKNVNIAAGATILGDGTVALILDVNSIK
ncbi:MAG: chemotaxis protein CheA [Clostridia bacterium]|jgi:two-component system chemotaxis sensor kinase CheA